jgi:hypothetical protein
MALFTFYALLFSLLASTLAVPLEQRLLPLVPPSEDPFYAVPDNLKDVAPGTILRHRKPPAPIAAFGLIKSNLKDSHQILYRTTDSFDNATATVLTVLVPYNADYTKVLSYHVAEDAPTLDCAPSYAFQFASETGGLFGTMSSQAELLLVQAVLEQGWVVIVPDHQGPKAAFLANKNAGQAILDGIRAALQSESITGIDPRPAISMWGYSGGGITTGWAAELQPTYAPELEIVAAAMGGIEPNLQTSIGLVNRSPAAGLLAAGMLGLANEYPVIENILQENLIPEYEYLFEKAKRQCLGAISLDFMFKDVTAMFEGPDITERPEVVEILKQNAMGQAVPEIPIFLYKGVYDQISPIRETDAIHDFYCANNASIEYQRDALAEHVVAAITGAPSALAYLIDAMNGRGPESACSKKTLWSSLMDPEAAKVLPQFIWETLLNLLGDPIGPGFFG